MTLDRYIVLHLLAGVALVFAGLTAISFTSDLVNDLDEVGRGQYGYAAAFEYALLRAPRRMHVLLPAAALIGGLLGLGWLARGSELVAMRAGGASVARLARAVMQAGAVVIALGIGLGEGLAPPADRAAHTGRAVALTGEAGLRSDPGFWGRDGRRFFRFDEVLSEGRARGVRIFEFGEDGALATAVRARAAAHAEAEPSRASEPSGPTRSRAAWRLEGVELSRFGGPSIESDRKERMTERLPVAPSDLAGLAVRPESLSTRQLAAYIDHLRDNGLRAARHETELWSRLLSPLATAVMLFGAVMLVLGPLRNAGLGFRIMVGVSLGIGLHVVVKVLTQLGVIYDFLSPAIAAAPLLGFGALALWWLRLES